MLYPMKFTEQMVSIFFDPLNLPFKNIQERKDAHNAVWEALWNSISDELNKVGKSIYQLDEPLQFKDMHDLFADSSQLCHIVFAYSPTLIPPIDGIIIIINIISYTKLNSCYTIILFLLFNYFILLLL